jgi:L-lactate dehydrogenase (cytochrome)
VVVTAQKRSLPRWSEIARFVGPSLRPGARDRLARVHTSDDFARLARRRVPRAVFDYVDGGAERETAVRRSTEAFERVTFHPHVLRDVTAVDTGTTVLGRHVAFPVVLGPTGFTRMMHTAGEPAVARAAARAGVPYALSTMGTTSVESLPALGDRWFQLYLWRDRGRSRDLIQRAAAAGCSTLVLTVDVPVAGARLRDAYNGLTVPPTLTGSTLMAMARRPRWVWDALTTAPLAFESLGAAEDLASIINTVFEPAVTPADVEWLRETWDGKLVVKGVQRVDDAKAAVAAGADALAVSNHGGRQLDRAVTPLDLLPHVVDAVGGGAEVYLDGGVRSGADVAAAVALGATAVFVARPYLYALMAAGEAGVDRLLDLLLADYARTLALLGVSRTADLDRSLVTVAPTALP